MINTSDMQDNATSSTNAVDDVLRVSREKENTNRIIRDQGMQQTGGMDFLAFLFNVLIEGEDALRAPEKLKEALNTLGLDDAQFGDGFFTRIQQSDTPLQDLIANTHVSQAVQNKFNVQDPVVIAQSSQKIYSSYEGDAWDGFLEHLMDREGYKNEVYEDSRGFLTVGVGHLVTGDEGMSLRLGDTISDAQVMKFLEEDAAEAYQAALEQAEEMGVVDKQVVIGLASVNYQLGTAWTEEFHTTWPAIKNGDYEQAISNLEGSAWNRQTPVRVDDFQSVLARAAQIRDGRIEIASLDSEGQSEITTASTSNNEQEHTLVASFERAGENQTPPTIDPKQPEPIVSAFNDGGISDGGVNEIEIAAKTTDHEPQQESEVSDDLIVGQSTIGQSPGARV